MTFDWTTFALQLVNVLILLAILRHFLFRPVAGMIDKRRTETAAALDAAEQARREAEAATARAQAEADASAAARHEVLATAAAEAEASRAALLEKARAEAAKIVEEGRAARMREAAASEARTMANARELAVTIAARAVAAQPKTAAGYAERLAAALDAMDPAERAALLNGGELRLMAPEAPADQDIEAAQAALARYGATAALETDPSLIAGLELRSGSGVVRNSLAHDLDLIAKALNNGRPAA